MKKTFFSLALLFVTLTADAQAYGTQTYSYDINHDGVINVTDVGCLVNKILGVPNPGEAPQAYLSCPDGNHPHLIDLGLPSGTKWACCNVGADKPEAYGGYYAWGETDEKDVYDDVSYLFSTGDDADGDGWYELVFEDGAPLWLGECTDIGEDIAGTNYDVAHVKWGGSWVMPTVEQYEELKNIRKQLLTVNGVEGIRFVGDNGGSIFLPKGGFYNGSELEEDGRACRHWSSTCSISEFAFDFQYGGLYPDYDDGDFRCRGMNVRPVSK